MQKMMENIFFDIGGVLLHLHPERTLHYLHECTSIPENLIEEAFRGDIHHAYETGKLTDDEFFERYKARLPQPNGLIRSDFYKAWLRLLGEPSETMVLARNLAKTYPVWLVSNTNPCHIRYGEMKGYFKSFAGTVYSFEIGVRKPERGFFKKALEIAGVEAQSTLFIDDKLENVRSAQEMGFVTIHYRSNRQVRQELDRWLPASLKDDIF